MSNVIRTCGDPDMKLRRVETSFLAASVAPERDDDRSDCGNTTDPLQDDEGGLGNLSKIACSVLMNILYGARVARWDLLKATTRLAARVIKWTTTCDR